MSIRFDASGDNLQRTANLPAATGPFTAWGWFYVVNDIGAASQVFYDFFHTTNSDFPASLYFESFAGTGVAGVNSYENGTGTFNEGFFASRPATGTWNFWAVTLSSGTVTGYWRALGSPTWNTCSCSLANSAGQSIDTVIHSHSTGDWTDHRAMYCGLANRAYSQTDLSNQYGSKTLFDATSINTWCINDTAANAGVDTSGNGRNWTKAGSFTTEADAPIGYTVSAAVATFTLSGIATGLKVSRQLVAAQQSYALTGIATGLKVARKFAASVSAYTLTGNATGLRADRKLVAAQATYALTGIAVALRVARKLVADLATYVLTGVNVALNYSGSTARTLVADTVAFTLTGVAAGLKASRQLAAGVGSYTLTGFDVAASSSRGRVSPSGGWEFLERLNPPRRIRVADEEIELPAKDIPRVIRRIKSAAETKAERRAAFRAAEFLSKTQPIIDLDAPWARDFIARVLFAYLAEKEAVRRAQQDADALVLLLI